MFCPKCGTKALDGAGFCQKCGTKLIVDAPTEQSASTPPASATQRPNPVPADISKKKSKRPIIIGVMAAVVVLAIVFVVLNWEGKIDYVATVRAYEPFSNSQGLPYTCGEVIDKYIPNAKWDVRKSDDEVFVDISGTVKGADSELIITIQVKIEEDHATMKPISTKLDGREPAEDVFFALFVAYDEKDDDLSHLDELIREVDFALRGGQLAETFTYEIAGISFSYPDWWVIVDSPSEYEIVKMISPRNSGNHIASFSVTLSLDSDPFGVFTGDEAFVRDSVNEYHTFLDYGDVMLGDIPAKALRYQTAGLNGADVVVALGYIVGGNVYWVTCSYAESTSAVYESIFQAMIESYHVMDSGDNTGPVGSIEEAQKLVENWLADHPMGPMAGAGTGAAANDVPSISAEYFVLELWEAPREFCGLVYVRKSDGYMTFHDSITDKECDLDTWYENQYGFVASDTPFIEELRFVNKNDEYSTFTLYSDGTFSMEVNLYVGYGNLFGSYEETDHNSVKCYVEQCDFEGYVGDDVSEFEMVFYDNSLTYRGEWIGTTMDGTVYYVDNTS